MRNHWLEKREKQIVWNIAYYEVPFLDIESFHSKRILKKYTKKDLEEGAKHCCKLAIKNFDD
jgi:hypothetical protein